MLEIKYSSQFKKDYKIIKKPGYNLKLLENVLEFLANKQELPRRYRDHLLVGNYKGFRECHITSDWLLIYKIKTDVLVLNLARTGIHSDLF